MSSPLENGELSQKSDTLQEPVLELDGKSTDTSFLARSSSVISRKKSSQLPDEVAPQPPKRMNRKKTFIKDFLAEALPPGHDVTERKTMDMLSNEERKISLAQIDMELLDYFQDQKLVGSLLKKTRRHSSIESTPSTSQIQQAPEESAESLSKLLDIPEEDEKGGSSAVSEFEDGAKDTTSSEPQRSLPNVRFSEMSLDGDESHETSDKRQTSMNNNGRRTSWLHRSGFVGKEPLDHRKRESWIGAANVFDKMRRERIRSKVCGILDPYTTEEVGNDDSRHASWESALVIETAEEANRTPFSNYLGKDTLWPDEFEQQFVSFSRVNDPTSNGKSISLSNIDKWLEKANILNQGPVRPINTGLCFLVAVDNKRNGKALGFEQFIRFLKLLGQMKKIPLEDLINKLAFCGPPLIFPADEDVLQRIPGSRCSTWA